MNPTFKNMLKKMLTSKKFIAMLLGVAIPPLNAAAGLGLGIEEMASMIAAITGYIVSQGIADQGKEAELAKLPQ